MEWQKCKDNDTDKKALIMPKFNKIRNMVKYEVIIRGGELTDMAEKNIPINEAGVKIVEEWVKEAEAVDQKYQP
jgi:hypothetical protein